MDLSETAIFELSIKIIKALNNKGIALKNLDKNEQAAKCFNKAIQINPNYI
jgi:tetratricopeptide (TPR) repeat protein